MLKFFNRPKSAVSTIPAADLALPEVRPLIELRQVLKIYNTPAGDFTVLKNVDLTVSTGEFVAVIGKSGSGKSTLINMITGIDRPTYGEVVIGGVPIHNLNENQIAKWRGSNLGVIFQFFQLLPTLTVLENIMLPMELRQTFPPNQRKERAMHLLSTVGLAEQAHKFPAAISGGQQQRVAIARALANDPDILVGDEPTGSLDSKTADSIFRLFEDFVAQGKTIVIVTHDRELAGRIPRVVFIDDGEITDQHVAAALPALTQQELARVSSQLEPTKYAPGQVIFEQGDPADSFYIIIKGSADVVLRHPTGAEVVVGTLSTGQYFGEMGIMEGGKRTATVKASADEELVVMQLDRENFSSLVESSDMTRDDIVHLMRQRVMEQKVSDTFRSLTADQIDAVMQSATIEEYQPGETLLRAGDPATRFFILAEGAINLVDRDAPPADQVMREVEAGQTFGEMDVLRGEGYTSTAVASKATKVICIDNDTIDMLSRTYGIEQPEIVQMLTRRYLETTLGEMLPGLRRRKRTMDFDLGD